MSTALSAFTSKIRPHALRCPDFTIEEEVLNAARRFCDETWVWTSRHTLNLSEDVQSYTLTSAITLPASSEIIGVHSVTGPWKTTGSELSSGTLTLGDWYKITAMNTADFTADGADQGIMGEVFQATAQTVTLDASNKVIEVTENTSEHTGYAYDLIDDLWEEGSAPSEDFSLRILLVLRPALSVTTLPDFLHDRFELTLRSGALAELLARPAADWTNFELARYHDTLFRRDLAKQKRRANKGYGRGSLRVQVRKFM